MRSVRTCGAGFTVDVGAKPLYLMCCSLLLATRLSGIDPYFGGLNRRYAWQKRTVIASLALLVPRKLILGAALLRVISRSRCWSSRRSRSRGSA